METRNYLLIPICALLLCSCSPLRPLTARPTQTYGANVSINDDGTEVAIAVKESILLYSTKTAEVQVTRTKNTPICSSWSADSHYLYVFDGGLGRYHVQSGRLDGRDEVEIGAPGMSLFPVGLNLKRKLIFSDSAGTAAIYDFGRRKYTLKPIQSFGLTCTYDGDYYAIGDQGWITVVNTTDGKLKWKYDLDSYSEKIVSLSIPPDASWVGLLTTYGGVKIVDSVHGISRTIARNEPIEIIQALSGERLIVGTASTVSMLDGSGNTIWSKESIGFVDTFHADESLNTVITLSGGALRAFHLTDGSMKWEKDVKAFMPTE